MLKTQHFKLNKPEQSDVVNIEDLNDNFDILDTELKKVSDKASLIQTAGGTGTAITLNNMSLVSGAIMTFVVKANNNGAATTINDKPLYKPGTTTAPKLIAGKAVTVWYSAADACFFIKASAEGSAVAEHVLAGKTFSNDEDTGIEGTMPNYGAIDHSLPINGSYTIPEGYHNGKGKVTQSIPTKAAATIIPGTTDKTIPSGQYLTGTQTIKGDSNLVPANILKGKSIFGVAGNVEIGKKFASGTVVSSSHNSIFEALEAPSTRSLYHITVSGLTFKPSFIYAFCWYAGNLYITIYDEFSGSPSSYLKKVSIASLSAYGNDSGGYPADVYKGDKGNAYVNSSGFRLPVGVQFQIMHQWFAWE